MASSIPLASTWHLLCSYRIRRSRLSLHFFLSCVVRCRLLSGRMLCHTTVLRESLKRHLHKSPGAKVLICSTTTVGSILLHDCVAQMLMRAEFSRRLRESLNARVWIALTARCTSAWVMSRRALRMLLLTSQRSRNVTLEVLGLSLHIPGESQAKAKY